MGVRHETIEAVLAEANMKAHQVERLETQLVMAARMQEEAAAARQHAAYCEQQLANALEQVRYLADAIAPEMPLSTQFMRVSRVLNEQGISDASCKLLWAAMLAGPVDIS